MVIKGSRAQVMNENADETRGGLRKKDLMYNKQGRIVSRRMSNRAKKDNRLVKAGWVTKKGEFGSFQKSPKSSPKEGKRSGSRSRPRSRSRSRPRSRRK